MQCNKRQLIIYSTEEYEQCSYGFSVWLLAIQRQLSRYKSQGGIFPKKILKFYCYTTEYLLFLIGIYYVW